MTLCLRLLFLFAITLLGVSANIIGFSNTYFNTDFVMSGVGMRDSGSGTLSVSGVSGPVTKAVLYWHGPTNSTDPLANASVTFDGNDIRGANIGLASDNCWGYANSQAYFADVTPFVSGDGNYALSNFTKNNNNININGAGLIVFHDDGDDTNNRDLVVFHGNDSTINSPYDPEGWDVTLNGITYSGGNANMRFFVSDGQIFQDSTVFVNGTAITVGNQIFDGNVAGPSFNGTLWDVASFDITSLLNPGNNNLNLTCGHLSDCLSLVMLGIDLPAGAAPPTGNVPEPSTYAMLGGGLAVLYWLRRKKA